ASLTRLFHHHPVQPPISIHVSRQLDNSTHAACQLTFLSKSTVGHCYMILCSPPTPPPRPPLRQQAASWPGKRQPIEPRGLLQLRSVQSPVRPVQGPPVPPRRVLVHRRHQLRPPILVGPRHAHGSQIRPLHRQSNPCLLPPPLRRPQLPLHRPVLPTLTRTDDPTRPTTPPPPSPPSTTLPPGTSPPATASESAPSLSKSMTPVAHGAKPSAPPILLGNRVTVAEVQLYGDVVLRYVSYSNSSDVSDSNPDLWFLPGFEATTSSFPLDFGLRRLDHAVGNVEDLKSAVSYVKGFTGFHEFAEFTAEDVGTSESGLNSVVLANNEEMVLFPMNEPVYGTKRKSQIQTYLEHNEGAGVQHLALVSEDIFKTLREMRSRSGIGGFQFMPSPPPTYYRNLKKRAGDVLTDDQIKECEELGILVDRDDQGTLLQIFTKPVGDRPTIFVEIIQRVGCMLKDEEGKVHQKGGCGGFGKGNFSELFKSIEEYEKTLEARQIAEPAAA
ncbi:phytoene desaturation 1, partial [Prunus dulcis]